MWFFPFFGVFMEFHILNGQGTVCRHVLCSVFLVSFSVLVDIIHASRVNQKQFGRRTICLVGSCCMRGFSLDNTELRGGTLTVPRPCTHSSTHVMGQVQVHSACVRQTHLQAAPVSSQCLFHATHFENELHNYCNLCVCCCLTPDKWRMFLFIPVQGCMCVDNDTHWPREIAHDFMWSLRSHVGHFAGVQIFLYAPKFARVAWM